MSQYNLAEAKSQLSDLTHRAMAGEEIVIASDNDALVRLVSAQPPKRPRQPGSGKGRLLWMAPDFDDIPEGFEDDV